MCTVSYLPLQSNGFILTSNRDENPQRPTETKVAVHMHEGRELIYPKDMLASGTWIASSKNYTLCLLNGAFQKHNRRPPYRKSRGLILLDFFEKENPEIFFQAARFEEIEPFTLLVIHHHSDQRIEMRWDSITPHVKYFDATKPALWCSATLYDAQMLKLRLQWFETWLSEQQNFAAEEILHFHKTGGNGNRESDLVMHRMHVQTVSITCVEKHDELAYTYIDLLRNSVSKQLFPGKSVQ